MDALPRLSFAEWQIWVPVFVGSVVGGVVLLTGFIRYRRQPLAVPPRSKRGAPHLDHVARRGSSDQRRSFRRTGNEIKVFLSDGETFVPLCEGWVMDRSTGGLCLAVPRRLEIGTLVGIRAANAPDNSPRVQIQVLRCGPIEDYWEAGCQFVGTPSWGTLLLFG